MKMMVLRLVGAIYAMLALASSQGASAGCPFSAGRRSLQQLGSPFAAPAPVPTSAPVPASRPSGLEAYGGFLDYDYYTSSCPEFQPIVKNGVTAAALADSLAPAALLRLFFHDCFVMGCDASILLNSTLVNLAEKDNQKSFTLAKFNVIDTIKAELEAACPEIVSCADILAAVAAESVQQSGGPHINLAYGRRDGMDSFSAAAQTNVPLGLLRVPALEMSFRNVGLDLTDLVALSGAHTIGQARCDSFDIERFKPSGTTFDPVYGAALHDYCFDKTLTKPENDRRKVALDASSTTIFDNGYFQNLLRDYGVLASDHDLKEDLRTIVLVKEFAGNQSAFFAAFAKSMQRMSRIGILSGTQGQVRKQCWVRNRNKKNVSSIINDDFEPRESAFCSNQNASAPCPSSCGA